MLWNNALRDHLPPHDSEVLINVNGNEYISIFCAEQKHFRVYIEDQLEIFKPDQQEIHWTFMHLATPGYINKLNPDSTVSGSALVQEPARSSFTILIADDDLDDQELMKRGLKDCKVKVNIIPLYDGIKLMDYLLKRQEYKNITTIPDLILLDLNMPLMDGFEVLKEIRKYPHLQKIPLFVITTSRNTDDGHKALELGANGFYTKGARSKDILQIMKTVCQECF